MTSWMLARLSRDTEALRAQADESRLHPLRSSVTSAGYAAYLVRIFGFEAPVERELARTSGIDRVVELGWRTHMRLLRSDLLALGITDPSVVAHNAIARFGSVSEALGWLYVVEHTAVLNGQVRRHLERGLPQHLAGAGCYLRGSERGAGARLAALGGALDAHAHGRPEVATVVGDAARIAFRKQRRWFAEQSLQLAAS